MVLVEVVVRPSDHMTMLVVVFVAPAELAGIPTLSVQENCPSFDWLAEVEEVEAAADLVIAEVPAAAAVETAAGTSAVVVAEVVAAVVMTEMVEVVRKVNQSNRTLVLVMIILKVEESSASQHLDCDSSYFLVGQRTVTKGAVVMMTVVAVHHVVHR